MGKEFYEVCEAKSQSGKTLWIGTEKDEDGNWTIFFGSENFKLNI